MQKTFSQAYMLLSEQALKQALKQDCGEDTQKQREWLKRIVEKLENHDPTLDMSPEDRYALFAVLQELSWWEWDGEKE